MPICERKPVELPMSAAPANAVAAGEGTSQPPLIVKGAEADANSGKPKTVKLWST